MNCLRNHFFSRPALPLQEHSRAAVRHLAHKIEDLQHGLALAHNIFEVIALLEGALELNVLFFRFAPRHCGPYVRQQLFVVPRLLDEIGRARLHRAHRIFHGAVRGNHDYRQPDIVCMNLRQNFHAVAPRQGQIEQHQIERTLGYLRQPILTGLRRLHFESFQFEQGLKGFANLGFIIDDEH